MLNRTKLLLLVYMTVFLAGCHDSPLLIEDRWADRRPIGERLETYLPPRNPDMVKEDPNIFKEPTGDIKLSDALAAAMLKNPTLALYSWDVRLAEAEQISATAKLDPDIDFRLSDIGGTGTNSGVNGTFRVRLSQTFEMGDKRAKRMEVARLSRNLSAWDYEAQRLAVATEVANRYIAVLVAQQKMKYRKATLEIDQEVIEHVEKRIKAGFGTKTQLENANLEIELNKILLKEAEHEFLSARLALSAMWGSNTPKFNVVVGNIESVQKVASIENLRARLSQNPAVARWSTELAHRLAAVQLAKAEKVNDIEGGVGVSHDLGNGEKTFLVEIEFPLSIHGKNNGDVLHARYSVAQARAAQRVASLNLENQLIDVYGRLALAYEKVEIYKGQALERAKRSLEDARNGYIKGLPGYNFRDIVDAKKQMAEFELNYVESLTAYHYYVNELESLIGQPLETVGTEAKPEVKAEEKAEGK